MAKLTRPTETKIFGSTALAAELTPFGSAVPSTDINLILNSIEAQRGWGTIGANGFPPMEWFNALGYGLSYYNAYLMQQGIPEWTALQEFYVNSICTGSNGKQYRSKTGVSGTPNSGNNPTTDTTEINWVESIKVDMPAVINGATAKTVPVDADIIGLVDSAASFGLKKTTWANIKATLKTYFDTLYASISSLKQIQPITASVATSALTATLNPTTLDFRSATLGNGAVTTLTVASAISLVVPSAATLGTTNAVLSRLILIAINNAGTVELAIVNSSGGNNLDETTLISTTALSATADLANVIYSTTARTNVPFRVVGYIESTQATAGTWATAPSTIQGYGGQALAAMSSLGYGQTWQDVTASRVSGTTYTNSTGKPIQIIVYASGTNDAILSLTVNSVLRASQSSRDNATGNTMTACISAIILNGDTYVITASSGAITKWTEVR